MSDVLLHTESLVKRYGGLLATDNVSLDIRHGELHAIIGPNGAGKTTLVNQLSGELFSNEGKILFAGADITSLPVYRRARIGLLRSYQITAVFDEFTVLENAALAALGAKKHAFSFWLPLIGHGPFRKAAGEALKAVGLAGCADTLAADLAYGERRQLELAMALAAEPKFLLLDEPMAGMSVQESSIVVALLQSLKQHHSILLIEHDMEAVFALADRITVLVYGRVMFTGTPDEIRKNPEVRAVYLGEESIAEDL